MTPVSNHEASIIRTERGLTIAGTRITKVNDRFNQITMLLVAIVGLVVALLIKLAIVV